VQDLGVGLAHHLLGFIAIQPLVPEQDSALQVLANDGVFSRSLQNVGHEVHGLLGFTDDDAVEELAFHLRLPASARYCLA
jgi:hypothetical protein